MSSVIRMPEVLTGMSEATLLVWYISPGDEVAIGQSIAEVETEKATVELEADQAGVAAGLLVEIGEAVVVGRPILVLADAGESVEEATATVGPGASAPVITATPGVVAAPPATEPTAPNGQAAADGAPTLSAAPAGQPAARTPGQPDRRFATPLVRRLARERGIDLATVNGTGPGGRVVRRDLDRHEPSNLDRPERADTRQHSPTSPVPEDDRVPTPVGAPSDGSPPPVAAPGRGSDALQDMDHAAAAGFTDVPHTGMRRAIARRLTESKSTVPHFYMALDCRVDALLDLRRRIKEESSTPVVPSLNDFVIKAAGAAFRDVPEANVIWTVEAVRRFDSVSIAMAVALDDGLVTPVIRDVDRRSLTDVSRTAADFVTRAREGRLKQAELEGGSFTVSNLGMYGIERFGAIISPPHSGILAVGAATKRPVISDDGKVEVATIMTVTLSGDHRALDGALAARWLRAFQAFVENPMRMLL